MAIPFDRNFDAPIGETISVSPLIHRVLAPNPGPFTFRGTGVYIVGDESVAVIDPGPAIPVHIDALKKALAGKRIEHILVTHTHLDHSPAAEALKQWSGAKTYAFGPHGAGKAEEGVAVEEGGDRAFKPDIPVRDGDGIEGADYTIDCIFTPGHTSNHMCFALREEKALFTGDHVMGWSTTVIAPPDGDMAAYMSSLEKLLARDDTILWPTHGGPIRDPKPFLKTYIEHRRLREAQILTCLAEGIDTIPALVARLYANVDKKLHPAAARSVLAHLLQLIAEGRVMRDEQDTGTRYRLV
jgi:glyoxylase-like metal-dependent hydrolase (beta-lactamase superfamily II)